MNYKKIYDSIIGRAKNRELSSDVYVEEHHILPKSVYPQFKKSKWNLVNLLPEEHLIAHLLLVKIYPNSEKLIYAANGMSNGFNKGNRYTNKKYAWLKKKHSKIVAKNSTGMVNAKDEETGEYSCVPKDIFDNNKSLVGVTKGNVNVFDNVTGEYVSVKKGVYHNNKDRYIPTGKGRTLVWNKDKDCKEYIDSEEVNMVKHIKYMPCLDTKTNMVKQERIDIFNKTKTLIGLSKNMVNIVDTRDNKTKQITTEEFYKNKEFYKHKSEGTVSVIIRSTEETKQITTEEFYKNRELYYTINERFTNCIDTRTMKKIRVSREDYKSCEYYVSNKSKRFNIYNSSGELMYETFGNFDKVCADNNLPRNALKDSRGNNGKPIYLNVGSNAAILEKKGLLRYKGWYVLEGA